MRKIMAFIMAACLIGSAFAATTWLQITNGAEGTLSANVSDSATTFVLDTGQGAAFPASGNFNLVINDAEIVTCTARTSDTLTVTRGAEGTSATAHSDGATVALNVTKAYLTQHETAINGIENGTTTLTSVTTSGGATVGTDLLVNGGDIGITTDADLIGLASAALTVRGTLTATGGITSTAISGGTGAFTTLASSGLTTANSLSVTTTAGITGAATLSSTLAVTGFVTNGVSDQTQGLISIQNGTTTQGGRLDIYNGPSVDDYTNRWRLFSNTSGDFAFSSIDPASTATTEIFTFQNQTLAINLKKHVTAVLDLAVNGGDLTSTASAFNLLATPTTITLGAAASTTNIGSQGSGALVNLLVDSVSVSGYSTNAVSINVGIVDTQQASLNLRGGTSANGGILNFYNGDTQDTAQDYWKVFANTLGQFEILGVSPGASFRIDDTDDSFTMANTTDSPGELFILDENSTAGTNTFIKFLGTTEAGSTKSLSSLTGGNSVQGHIRVSINGTLRWIRFYDSPTT